MNCPISKGWLIYPDYKLPTQVMPAGHLAGSLRLSIFPPWHGHLARDFFFLQILNILLINRQSRQFALLSYLNITQSQQTVVGEKHSS